jgi:hypothetical protein
MSDFMQMQIIRKGYHATIECEKCGTTNHWHEWISDGSSADMVDHACDECGGNMDPDTLWVSPKQTWYAGRYSAPGYMDCTEWMFDTNMRRLEKELRVLYGD